MSARDEELRAALGRVRDRIESACAAAGRPADAVTLVVVTKFFPLSDLLRLFEAGVRDFGESRGQELLSKVGEMPSEVRTASRMHFIGRLQGNKAAAVASAADCVHSVDRECLIAPLSAPAGRERPLDALVQVSLDGDTRRGGAAPADVLDLARRLAAAPGLQVAGLMAVAPLQMPPAQAFGLLRDLQRDLLEHMPGAVMLSAGMSADLEQAVACGATHVRVGSAILGSRPAAG